MTRLWPALGALLVLAGCAHQELKFGLYVDDLEDGNRLSAGTEHRAFVKETTRDAMLESSEVLWAFDGSLAPAGVPGRFTVKGPGPGTITASFKAGSRMHALSATVMAPGAPPRPTAVATPRPVATPTPRPTPTPVPTPDPHDPEARIYQAYDLVAQGHYIDAVTLLRDVAHPDWRPKVRSLLAQWTPKAVDQGLSMARLRMAEGDPDGAQTVLDRIAALAKSPSQSRAYEALRRSRR